MDALGTQEDVQGKKVDGGRMDVDTEEDDDRESLDPEEMRKSSIYHFVRKTVQVLCCLGHYHFRDGTYLRHYKHAGHGERASYFGELSRTMHK